MINQLSLINLINPFLYVIYIADYSSRKQKQCDPAELGSRHSIQYQSDCHLWWWTRRRAWRRWTHRYELFNLCSLRVTFQLMQSSFKDMKLRQVLRKKCCTAHTHAHTKVRNPQQKNLNRLIHWLRSWIIVEKVEWVKFLTFHQGQEHQEHLPENYELAVLQWGRSHACSAGQCLV